MTLTKADIVEDIYRNTDLNRPQARKAVETFLESIKATLGSGEDVLISGFGKFYVKEKKERRGRNPATDKDLILPRIKAIAFKCSSVLRRKVNV